MDRASPLLRLDRAPMNHSITAPCAWDESFTRLR